MSAWTLAASRLTRSWAAMYTLGLASHVRESRRHEIASDVWEHQHDAEGASSSPGIGLQIFSRMLRGAPADLLWRINVEGPKMDIRIPFERIAGALLLGLVVLIVITAAISGYDTAAEGFESELIRLADMSTFADNMNAFFRIATGLALIGAAAGFYVSLRERSPVLATLAAFGLLAAAVLELVASGLQMVFVQLANEYVEASAADKPALVVNARTIAIAVENTTGAAVFALLMSIYTLAALTARENLVPRWLIGLPVLSVVVWGASLIAAASGVTDGLWFALVGGGLLAIVWLLIAGLWLMFSPRVEGPAVPAPMPAAS